MVGSGLSATVIEARDLKTRGLIKNANPYAALSIEGQKV
jgi:hypothetical protein